MGKNDKARGGGQGQGPIQDPRFAAMHTDPRFQRFPNSKRTVAVDERFAGMFKDPDFQSKAAVDKRGRKVQRKSEDLRRYYHLKDEEEWKEDADKQQQQQQQQKQKEEEQQQQTQEKQKQQAAGPVKGKAEQSKGQLAAASEQPSQKRQAKARSAAPSAKGSKPPLPRVKANKQDEGVLVGPDDSSSSEENDEEEEGAEDPAAAAAKERWLRARGLLDVSSSSDEEEDDEDQDSDDDHEEQAVQGQEYDKDDKDDSSADEPLGPEDSAEASLDMAEWGVGAMAANPNEEIPMIDETRRLAIVDLDWDHVKAVDILAVLRSFLPPGGEVQRVTVYPSDYGLQRMAEEAQAGPQRIFKTAGGTASKAANGHANSDNGSDDDESDDEDEDETEDDEDEDGDNGDGNAQQGMESDGQEQEEKEEEKELDKARLAMYERSKLRYYYAVVECDTIATALHLYNECDGIEFERSACKFDLRFVPDDQSFEERQVRDTATAVPADYEPPSAFNTSLQHTDPKLTWDADDDSRKKVLHRRLTEDEIKEADFVAYLGSDDEGGSEGDVDDNDPEALRQRYRSLLLGGNANEGDAPVDRKGGKSWGGGGNDGEVEEANADGAAAGSGDEAAGGSGSGEEEAGGAHGAKPAGGNVTRIKGYDGMEMEVTFAPGLESLGARLLAKKREEAARGAETVWEAYQRKRRERKMAKKLQGRQNVDSSTSDDDDDDEPGTSNRRAKAGHQASGADVDDDMYGDVGHDDPFFQHDDDPFNDPFFKDANGAVAGDGELVAGSGRGKSEKASGEAHLKGGKAGKCTPEERASSKEAKRREKEEAARQQAELELLLMDEGALRDAARGAGTQALRAAAQASLQGTEAGVSGRGGAAAAGNASHRPTKKELRAAKKAAKQRRREGSDNEDIADDGFALNLEDPRFSQMFESHHFALDPTDPRFQKTKGSEVLMKAVAAKRAKGRQQQQQQQQDGGQQREDAGANGTQAQAHNEPSTEGALQQLELKSMVAKLKRKAGAAEAAGKQQQQGKAKKAKAF